MTTITTTEAKAKFLSIVRKTSKFGEKYVITHRGLQPSVLLSIEAYEGFIETIDILKNEALVKEIAKSLNELKHKKTYSFEKVVGRKQKK